MGKENESKITRREFFKLAGLGGLCLALSACAGEKKPEAASTPKPTLPSEKIPTPKTTATAGLKPTPKAEIEPKIPYQGRSNYLWGPEQIEYFRLPKDTRLLTYQTTVYEKPPFYNGPEPLVYKSYQQMRLPGPFGGLGTTIAHDFGGFMNLFVYENPLTIMGTVTLDKNKGVVLAEARVEYVPKKEGGVTTYLYEVHYDENGKIIFTAKSEITSLGFKVKEVETQGRKKSEYYFVWPTGW